METRPDVVRRQHCQQVLQAACVVGADRSQPHQACVAQCRLRLQLVRIGHDRRRHGRRAIAQPDARIQRDHPGGVRQERIDVELDDLAVVQGQLRDRHQQPGDRIEIHREAVAIAAQQAGDAGAPDQPARQFEIQRRQGQGGIGDHLHPDAALAEQHDRAESGVHADADDQLERIRPADHLFDDEALDRGIRLGGGYPQRHRRRGFADRRGAGQVQHHAADIGFVHDLARLYFQCDRSADRLRLGGGFLGRLHHPALHHRNAIGGQDRFHLQRIEPFPARRARLGQQAMHGGAVRRRDLVLPPARHAQQ